MLQYINQKDLEKASVIDHPIMILIQKYANNIVNQQSLLKKRTFTEADEIMEE